MGMIKRDEQSNELTVEKSGSFIDDSMAEIRDAYLELNLNQTRVQNETRIWKHQRDLLVLN